MGSYTPYSERADWADLAPVLQDDGPNPPVPIAYTARCEPPLPYLQCSRAAAARLLLLLAPAFPLPDDYETP